MPTTLKKKGVLFLTEKNKIIRDWNMPRLWDDNTGRSLQRCPSILFLGKCDNIGYCCNISAVGFSCREHVNSCLIFKISILMPYNLTSEGHQPTDHVHLHLTSQPWRIREVEVEQGRYLAQLRFQARCGIESGSASTARTKCFRTKKLKVYEPAAHQKCFLSQVISLFHRVVIVSLLPQPQRKIKVI